MKILQEVSPVVWLRPLPPLVVVVRWLLSAHRAPTLGQGERGALHTRAPCLQPACPLGWEWKGVSSSQSLYDPPSQAAPQFHGGESVACPPAHTPLRQLLSHAGTWC